MATVIADGFETGAISTDWTSTTISGLGPPPYGSFEVVSSPVAVGTKSLQMNWFANNTGNIVLIKGSTGAPLSINDLYFHFRVRWAAGFDWFPGNTQGKKLMRTWGTGSNDDIIFLIGPGGSQTVKFQMFVNQDTSQSTNLRENIGDFTPVETERWYCFDLHVLVGMSNTGLFEGWIDGVKKFYYPNINTAAVPINKIELGGNLSPDKPTQNQTEWYDDVIVTDTNPGFPTCGIPIEPGVPASIVVMTEALRIPMTEALRIPKN
jgi:hypothetical protein